MSQPSREFLDFQAALVPVHRVGEAGGFVFFVMSYVEGETLGDAS